jgi:hypothetical protein
MSKENVMRVFRGYDRMGGRALRCPDCGRTIRRGYCDDCWFERVRRERNLTLRRPPV